MWALEYTLASRKDNMIPSDHSKSSELVEVKSRIKRDIWINIYNPDASSIWGYESKEAADRCPRLYRKACIKVSIDCEEGEGLN